jgi:chemotaxis protein methyltransferase CheR
MVHQLEINDQELIQFLEDLNKVYEIDFREYGKAHLKRRIRHRMTFTKYKSFSELSSDVLNSKIAFDGFFTDLSINVTELFRDPMFYSSLHKYLEKHKPKRPLRIWISACATGEEVFSIMMMLEHFNISYEKIYASDFNEKVVERAATGVMETVYIKEYLKNMNATGFGLEFYQFFDFKKDFYQLKEVYLDKLEFMHHNLMNTPPIEDLDIVLCRNVLIYFEKELQNKVIRHLSNSLNQGGLLCLGAKESLRFMTDYQNYTTIDQSQKIYLKK